METMNIAGKDYEILEYLETPDGKQIPLLNIKMMSDERWIELANRHCNKQ